MSMIMRLLLGGLLVLAAVAAGAASASATPGLATGEPIEIPFFRIFIGLLVSVMVALIAVLALKRFQTNAAPLPGFLKSFAASRPDALIEVLETRRMSQHGEVSLIACNGRRYLIVATSGQAIVVDRYPDAPESSASLDHQDDHAAD